MLYKIFYVKLEFKINISFAFEFYFTFYVVILACLVEPSIKEVQLNNKLSHENSKEPTDMYTNNL